MKNSIRHALKTGWYIWFFPLMALAISGYFLYDYFSEQGPRIRIAFEDAASVQPEKTEVKFRGVEIGLVKDVSISEDQKLVYVDVLLRKDARSFAKAGSKFSLVKPKVGFQGISGLDTLFEGTYISVTPGPANAEDTFEFKATSLPSTEVADDTSIFFIETPSAESLSSGDSVTYRGMRVGTLTKMSFAKGAQKAVIQINVENRFAHLIRENTKFWRKVGVQAKLGLFGSDIKVNSMDSIMNGAMEFATPDPPGKRAKNREHFAMLPAAPKDAAKWNPVLE